MTSAWVEHCKAYAKKHNVSYKQAMTDSRASYEPKTNKIKKPKRVIRGKGEAVVEPSPDDKQVEEKEVQTEKEKETPNTPDVVEKQTQTEPQEEELPQKQFVDYLIPLRKPGVLEPSARKLLEKVGNEKITSIDLVRSPIPGTGFLKRLGFYKKVLGELYYDDLFHLAIVINDKYDLEKDWVVRFKPKIKRAKKEVLSVPLPTGYDTSIAEFIDNTRRAMGTRKFSEYNVITNNCQNFVSSALKANKIMTPEARKFARQNINELFNKLPRWATKLATAATNTRGPLSFARINRLIRGEGMEDEDVIDEEDEIEEEEKEDVKEEDNQYPSEPKGLILQFSSTEMSYLKDIYFSRGKYRDYDVVQAQMYYPDNFAIGSIGKLGWQQFPRSKKLGYHKHDVEWVAIYYRNGTPEKVVMSSHGLKEHNIYNYNECEFENGFLKVFVARNSHSNYNRPGLKKRLKGVANDVAAIDGKRLVFRWDQMKPARDINYPGCCSIVSGIKTQPTTTLTAEQRWSLKR